MAATDKLPDLKVATTLDFRIALSPSGRRYLRFSGLLLNTGQGPFDLRGKRHVHLQPVEGRPGHLPVGRQCPADPHDGDDGLRG